MKAAIKVSGMSCQHCVKRVTDTLTEMKGIEKVEVSLDENLARVEMSQKVSTEKIKVVLEDIGFGVEE